MSHGVAPLVFLPHKVALGLSLAARYVLLAQNQQTNQRVRHHVIKCRIRIRQQRIADLQEYQSPPAQLARVLFLEHVLGLDCSTFVEDCLDPLTCQLPAQVQQGTDQRRQAKAKELTGDKQSQSLKCINRVQDVGQYDSQQLLLGGQQCCHQSLVAGRVVEDVAQTIKYQLEVALAENRHIESRQHQSTDLCKPTLLLFKQAQQKKLVTCHSHLSQWPQRLPPLVHSILHCQACSQAAQLSFMWSLTHKAKQAGTKKLLFAWHDTMPHCDHRPADERRVVGRRCLRESSLDERKEGFRDGGSQYLVALLQEGGLQEQSVKDLSWLQVSHINKAHFNSTNFALALFRSGMANPILGEWPENGDRPMARRLHFIEQDIQQLRHKFKSVPHVCHLSATVQLLQQELARKNHTLQLLQHKLIDEQALTKKLQAEVLKAGPDNYQLASKLGRLKEQMLDMESRFAGQLQRVTKESAQREYQLQLQSEGKSRMLRDLIQENRQLNLQLRMCELKLTRSRDSLSPRQDMVQRKAKEGSCGGCRQQDKEVVLVCQMKECGKSVQLLQENLALREQLSGLKSEVDSQKRQKQDMIREYMQWRSKVQRLTHSK